MLFVEYVTLTLVFLKTIVIALLSLPLSKFGPQCFRYVRLCFLLLLVALQVDVL